MVEATRTTTSNSEARADAIVVAYQSAEVLRSCVESLRQDPAVNRIVVVNNSPGDRAAAAVEGIEGVAFVESPKNLGYGRGVNQVRDSVKCAYVVLANPDTTQDKSTVTESIGFLHAKPQVGLMGPRMLIDGRLHRTSQHPMRLMRMVAEKIGGPERLHVSRTRAEHERAHPTEYVIGSFVVCRRTALDAVGWFDESIFLFGEDQDLCRRLRSVGWEVWFAPVGKVTHKGGHSWRQLSDEGRTDFRASRRRELRANDGRLAVVAYSLLERLSELAGQMRRLAARSR